MRSQLPRRVAVWLLGAAISAGLALAYAAESPAARDPDEHFFEPSFGEFNLKQELARAQAEGKRGVLIMFDDPECPWCAKMMSTVMNQVRVQDYYRQHFRALHINTRGGGTVIDPAGREVLEKDYAEKVHRVRATPVFLFLGSKGEVLTRFTGTTRDAEEFLWLGEYVASGEHLKRPFAAYKRERQAGKK